MKSVSISPKNNLSNQDFHKVLCRSDYKYYHLVYKVLGRRILKLIICIINAGGELTLPLVNECLPYCTLWNPLGTAYMG